MKKQPIDIFEKFLHNNKYVKIHQSETPLDSENIECFRRGAIQWYFRNDNENKNENFYNFVNENENENENYLKNENRIRTKIILWE